MRKQQRHPPRQSSPLHREGGQAYVELVLVLSLLSLIIAGVLFFGSVLYAKLAVSMASYDGARAAVEALDEGAGVGQGQTAARRTLEGFHMNTGPARVSVYSTSSWDRGQEVVCLVSYNLSLSRLPFVGRFFNPTLPVRSWTSLRVEEFRSDW